ncbi:hypothetical protein QQM79_19920 [Marinobacteraceae bacterium S3BR75-40.1]
MKYLMLLGVLGFTLFVGTLSWIYQFTQTDAPLSPQAKALLSHLPKTKRDSEAYFHLMGIHANPEANPLDVGRSVYRSIVEATAEYRTSGGTFHYQPYPRDRRLSLPEGPAFCEFDEPGCLRRLLEDPEIVAEALDEHALLAQRYGVFLGLDDYRTLSDPLIEEPVPPFQYLIKGARLALLKSVARFQEGDVQKALTDIGTHINRLQEQLRKQDTLIGKIVVAAIINDSLDVAMVLARRSGEKTGLELRRLSAGAMDFTQPIAREFAMLNEMADHLDRAPNFFSEDQKVPGWLVRIVFKPNMTVNAMVPVYSRQIAYSQLSHAELGKRLHSDAPIELSKDPLRNYIGDKLNAIAMPRLSDYVVRVHDVDVRIALFNTLANAADIDKALLEFRNPYDASLPPPSRSEDRTAVCFEGPAIHDGPEKCLRVALGNATTIEPQPTP